MNRFSLLLRFSPDGGLTPREGALFCDQGLCLEAQNLHPPARRHERQGTTLILVGNPIAGVRRDDQAVLDLYQAGPDPRRFARALNGSFLIVLYRPAERRLWVVNDRFASLAFYYTVLDGVLLGSLSLTQLAGERRAAAASRVDAEAAFEFIYFRRLFGEKTLDRDCAYLSSAGALTWGRGTPGPTVSKYWEPGFARPAPRGAALVARLSEALSAAVRMHTSDGKRYGLMLSGGLDSRALLAAAPSPPVCFTTCLTRNNEFQVAAEVAAAAGARHLFIERPQAVHDARLEDAVFLSGGMQVYSETQFLGYGPHITPWADVLMLGLGLDIFFAGLYLPKRPARLMGRPLLHHRLEVLAPDLEQQFMSRVGYRLKPDPFAVVQPRRRATLTEYLREQVRAILERGRALGARGYALWEYMHLHNLSRHYSFPMMASVRTFADCRSPALENELFDLALAMRAEDKLDGTSYHKAIARLAPALMQVRNANTNVRAGYSLRTQSAVKALRLLGHRLLGTRFLPSPSWQDRSWPPPRVSLDASPRLLERVRALPVSEPLAGLGFTDMDGVSRVVEEHLSGRRDHAVFLNVLLTLERYLAG